MYKHDHECWYCGAPAHCEPAECNEGDEYACARCAEEFNPNGEESRQVSA